mgnify:CR=1 FL=1
MPERDRIAPHFTDLDGPVFALVNLPETVKGALFARYSRYPGTLRRLFLDEFADSLPGDGVAYDGDEGSRASELYERVFVGYGDDSVAQLGGVEIGQLKASAQVMLGIAGQGPTAFLHGRFQAYGGQRIVQGLAGAHMHMNTSQSGTAHATRLRRLPDST